MRLTSFSRAVAFVLFAFFAAGVSLASAQIPAPGVIAFTGARVIDGTGAAPIEQATIVVTNGRITAIGPSATVMPPAGATVVNVAGKTIIPGLINSHAHIDPDISANPGPYRDEMVRRLKTYALYGVTSIMTLGFETYDEPEGFYLRDTQRLGIGPVATDAPRLYASAGRFCSGQDRRARRPQTMRGSTCSGTSRCGRISSSSTSTACRWI